ncbi:hypothetical protein llap_4729 [Limosa lapponica baueri]|uniref:Uncharacterized protein n=1 Tax=Limosa lapponica baueri TaxID=1758121 RepID=A0A2I0UFZ8_LIMLA|nr:hypothetical protein llap_4729 [Limosa lapponica baueri]
MSSTQFTINRTFHDEHIDVYTNIKQTRKTPLDYVARGGVPKEISQSLKEKGKGKSKQDSCRTELQSKPGTQNPILPCPGSFDSDSSQLSSSEEYTASLIHLT